MTHSSSKIFNGYRALGINSDHVPCVIRYNSKHHETYVITSVGKAFHVYKVFFTITVNFKYKINYIYQMKVFEFGSYTC